MKKVILVLAVIMAFAGCSQNAELPNESTHYGGAILLDDSGQVPDDLYTDSGIYKTNEYANFTKAMDVYGIKFVAKDNIPDEFMLKIADAYKQMFAQNENTDTEMQKKVIENLYKHKALLPIVKSEKDAEGKGIEKLQNEYSICDIIMQTDNHQAMEVTEHLLHTVTDVGLNFAMPNEWGFDKQSTLSKTMKTAIDKKYFDSSSYYYGNADITNRIMVQEYAYWIITSYWNMQDTYGLGEDEWTLNTKLKMQENLASAHDLVQKTLDNVLYPIDAQTLKQIENHDYTVTKSTNITNTNYVKYVDTNDIQKDVSKLNKKYKKHFDKYIQYIAPNGKAITILAQDKVSDEQLLKAYNVLSFYLTSHKDYDMDTAANQMADNKAILVMPNGADGDKWLNAAANFGQPLYAMETPVTGDAWYINNDYDHRDASYEEILHLVHDYGIGTTANKQAMLELSNVIDKATTNALPKNKADWGTKGLWGYGSKDWLNELSNEGSLEQEYIVSVLDSYYGLWEAFTETDGGMWGVYIAKNRQEVMEKDAMGYEALTSFLPENFTYMDRISPDFEGTFCMKLEKDLPYTYKSQYILNARLTGSKNSSICGNDFDNILIGNAGDNTIDGQAGYDVVQFSGQSTEYEITGNTVVDTLGRDGVDTLVNIEVLRFTDKDIILAD